MVRKDGVSDSKLESSKQAGLLGCSKGLDTMLGIGWRSSLVKLIDRGGQGPKN